MHQEATKSVHFNSVKGVKRPKKLKRCTVGRQNVHIQPWWATVVPARVYYCDWKLAPPGKSFYNVILRLT